MILDDNDRDVLLARVDAMLAELVEYGCDSVQVVATARGEADIWWRLARGTGNIYARQGAVADWLKTKQAEILADELGSRGDDDGDLWKRV